MLTATQIDIVNVIAVTVSALSCLGSLFIIVCYMYFKHLRKFAFKLVCLLSTSDCLVSLLGADAGPQRVRASFCL
jgi:hypothetical protein